MEEKDFQESKGKQFSQAVEAPDNYPPSSRMKTSQEI